MRKALVLVLFLVLLTVLAVRSAEDPPIRRVKKELVITLDFIVNEESEVLVGKKRIKMDDIPEDGHVVELATEGNIIKKIVFEEKK